MDDRDMDRVSGYRWKDEWSWRRDGVRLTLVSALALALALGIAACSSPTEIRGGALDGTWEWIRATGGIAGTVRTPESEGHGYELEFDADSVLLRRPGSLELVAWSRYGLGVGEEGTSLAGLEVIRYELPLFGFDEQAIHRSGDQLVLVDPCCDGFTWEWMRK